MRTRLNQKATRWQVHARVNQPPGGWGPWREFTWQAAPEVDRTAPAAPTTPPPPAATATNTANPATGEPGKPPTATTPPPPPVSNLPAVQQPPSTNLPAVQQPPATTVPAVQQPTAQKVPALPQVPRQLPAIPNLPVRVPRSLPKSRSGTTATPSAESRGPQTPDQRESRLVSVTRLAVWDGKPMPASNQRVYVPGPVDVDWAKKSLQWWFRGLTSAPTAAPGQWRWEMSRAGFADFAPWKPLPGLGYAGSANGVQFSIDLNPYAPRPPDWPVTASSAVQLSPAVAQAGGVVQGGAAQGSGAQPTFSQRLGIPADLLGGGQPGQRGQFTQLSKLPPLQVSLSLWVRAVPLDPAGNDADLPSNAVELRFGPVEKTAPYDPNPDHWPVVTFVSYRPVQGYTFDWQCWVEASKDITAPTFWDVGLDAGTKDAKTVLFKKGTTRNLCAGDDSNIVDDFVDAVGGFIEMMGDFVDWVSKTYAALKSDVASKLASVIPGCTSNPVCAGAIQMGLNAGMAALGMPPDLPDFEQLQAMGEGYLVDAVAQQVAAHTNLPFADDAAKPR